MKDHKSFDILKGRRKLEQTVKEYQRDKRLTRIHLENGQQNGMHVLLHLL